MGSGADKVRSQVIEQNIRNRKMGNGGAEKGSGPSGQEKQVNEILLKKIVLAQRKTPITVNWRICKEIGNM